MSHTRVRLLRPYSSRSSAREVGAVASEKCARSNLVIATFDEYHTPGMSIGTTNVVFLVYCTIMAKWQLVMVLNITTVLNFVLARMLYIIMCLLHTQARG
jgi:hypothetical protein